MVQEKYDYYVLFHNHMEGMQLYDSLRKLGVFTRISPAPRVASVSCGMSLLVEEDAIEKVRRAIEETGQEYERIVKLPCQIDPRRDKYC